MDCRKSDRKLQPD